MAVKAYVLVVTDPGATKRVYESLSQIQGVAEIHEVMGPYDIIVELDVPNLVDVPPILSTRIRTIDGIQSTTSLVSFPLSLTPEPTAVIASHRNSEAKHLGTLLDWRIILLPAASPIG